MKSTDNASSDAQPAVAVRGLSSVLGQRRILSDISFNVAENEIFVIMGSSGAGKTTLMRHLLGLSPPRSGEIDLFGEAVFPSTRQQLFRLRRQIGVAFQHGALINSMSLIENIELPLLQHTRLDRQTIRIMSRMKLEIMNLAGFEDYMPAQLSGGMLKRAGLARAVVMDPKILFFDEPSAGLDPATAADLDELILRLRSAMNMTIVVVTHAIESALKIADRIMIIGDGAIRGLGSPQDIQTMQDNYIQSLLLRRGLEHQADNDAYIDRLTAPFND